MGYTITVSPTQIEAGQSTNLIINLNNTETNLTAYQMKIFLPTGVTVQKKANGKYAYTSNADRLDPDLFTVTVKDAADGSVLIAVFSPDKDVIAGTSGELIRLPIDVASTVTTSLHGSLKEIEFTDVNNQAYNISDVNFTLTMQGSGTPDPGVVTGDVTVSIPDVAITAGSSTNLIINMQTGLTNLTAYQMKLYLPTGVTVQKKANGKYAYTSNADRLDPDLFTITVKDAVDGSVLIAVFSPDKDVIAGTSGELIRLPIDVASTVTTSLQGSLKEIEFTDVNNQAYNISDVNFTLSIGGTVKEEQTLSLASLPEMTEGDAAYTLPQQTNQGLTLTWTVADATIASINGYQLTPLKAGTTTVTATQAGNSNYLPFTKTFTLTVNEKQTQQGVEVTDISQLDNAIYIEPFSTRSGKTVNMDIRLKNNQDIAAYSFNLVLPEGVTLAKNTKDKYIYTLAEDRHDEHSCTINEQNGTYSIAVLSISGGEISGNDGTVITLQVIMDESMEEGDYPIQIMNAMYSLPNGQTINVPETRTALTIENILVGDVNDNKTIDIGDAVCIVNYIVGKPNAVFVEKAADVNGNGTAGEIGDAVSVVNIIVGKTIMQMPKAIRTNILDPQ
jgi:hypothetical protein